jgi:hypothetical protein
VAYAGAATSTDDSGLASLSPVTGFDVSAASDAGLAGQSGLGRSMAARTVGASIDVSALVGAMASRKSDQAVARSEVDLAPAAEVDVGPVLDRANARQPATLSGRGLFGPEVALSSEGVEELPSLPPLPAAVGTSAATGEPAPTKTPETAATKNQRTIASLVESARLSAKVAAQAAMAAESAKSVVAARKGIDRCGGGGRRALDAASQVRGLARGQSTLDALKAILAAEQAALDARVNAQAAADVANRRREQATSELAGE